MARRDDTRALPREIFAAEANPIPDEREGTLTVALKTGICAKPRLIFNWSQIEIPEIGSSDPIV